ncbi:obscurin isoform X5 [Leptopilina heterotoma]|uniref:obscurin isoform X5 n=1 Tax=Leptopilina heterotoma TaxID=63436 RepID=UPI001CA7EA3C|nr:obscurin isoform X5 [Leptopilina heterotoma]
MSYCRITGRSRGLPKPNYFPLLPPISPADAKRFCRITGKSYGLPTHHYIPVLLGVHTHDKSKCKITSSSEHGPHHFTDGLILGEKKKHVVLKDYRYIFPILKGDGEEQKALRELLTKKETSPEEEKCNFVYRVDERRCSLVFPACLEAAVRDGDVRDVMLSRDCDSVLLRLKQGKNVSVDFKNLENFDDLYEGLGPREDVVKEREKQESEAKKKKRKRQNVLNHAKKIFEDKEKAAEEEELKTAKQLKLRSIKEERDDKLVDWKHVDIGHARSRGSLVMSSSEWRDWIKPLNQSCDWSTFEETTIQGTPVVDQIPEPVNIKPQIINLDDTPLGSINTPIAEKTGGFEAISVVQPFAPLTLEPDLQVQEALKNIPLDDLKTTMNVDRNFASDKESLETLPKVDEIPTLIKNFAKGEKAELLKVKGLKLDINSAQKFIAGQTIHTPTGPIFVPGQTLSTPKGDVFVPGFTVKTPEGPMLIPGQIISIPEESGKMTPVFVAGQTLSTKNGEQFVQGQTIQVNDGAKFIPGQTVLTKEGPKFVAGQVTTDGNFIPGQTISMSQGSKFMPGQTITDQHGEQLFVPGQSVQIQDSWEFVPGQCLKTPTGDEQFVPGQTMLTTEGARFVPGQTVIQKSGEPCFVPGISLETEEKLKFIPGITMNTPEGIKFVQGQMVKTEDGEKFVPGLTTNGKDGLQFAAAKSINEVVFLEATPVGLAIDPKTANAISHFQQQEIFGHMVQTDKGVEFIPESVQKFPEGKRIVPGQLVRGGKDSPRFVPGVMTDDGFLPGQIVMTEKGEQFVPGQVVDTSAGPKFVPGQMVEARLGTKFVPGQTIETADGPRFVPGQIVETKAGPTFIPGQVISTEDEGSRFVPGQVVDTPDGPRFVPGRVVESSEHGVIFVPGQIVQTEEGPRFVAPDLTDTPEGELEFSVQGFEVTPEELRLLRPQHLHFNATAQHHGESCIDSRMLQELSKAGMSVGRKISTDLPNVDVEMDPKAVTLEQALVIAEKLGLRGTSAVKMAQVVSTVAQLAKNIVHQQNQHIVMNGEQSNDEELISVSGLSHKLQNGESTKIEENLQSRQTLQDQQKRNKKLTKVHKNQTNGHDILPNGDHPLQNGLPSNKTHQQNGEHPQNHSHGQMNGNSILTNGTEEEMNTNWLHTAVKSAISAAIVTLTNEKIENGQDLLLSSISEAFNVLLRQKSPNMDESVDEVLQILLIPRNRSLLCRQVLIDLAEANYNKVDLLKSTLMNYSLNEEVVLEKLFQVVEEEHGSDLFVSAFRAMSKGDPDLLSRVLKKVSEEVSTVETEKEAAETVHKAIVQAVRESSELRVKELLNDEGTKVKEMLLQAVGLARALGMTSTASSLLAVLSDVKSTRVLAGDKVTLDILKRLTVMRKLAEERPQFVSALGDLCSDPELARSDPVLRTLVRESAALMIVPEEGPLQSSIDVPTSLLHAENSLAIEEFLMRRSHRPSSIFMILKQGFQCVVPREAARSVLTGEVAYTVLDEDGIHHFEPLNVFSALRMNKPAAHRFSMYCCPVAREEDIDTEMLSTFNGPIPITNTSSFDESTFENYERLESIGVTLSKSDKSVGCVDGRENTPSFRKICNLYHERKSENYVVVKEFAEGNFSVDVGEIVEAVEYGDSKKLKLDPELEVGEVSDRLDSSAAKHKLSVRPRKKYADPRARNISRSSSDSNINRVYVRTSKGKEGWLPTSIVMQTLLSDESSAFSGSHRREDSTYRREAVIKELVETEEEFGRDLQQVVERYLKPLDNPGVPRVVRDNKEIIFTNLKQIAEFHNTSFGRVLIEGVKYYADQPRMLGKTFLRLERDFDKHVAYCRDEPAAQEFLQMNDGVREYFEELSQTLGDDKRLSEHLKLPIQRINDYQLLLKELVKYSTRLGENCDDLQNALELMLGIPHRATDNKFISNIEGYKGNIHKLGRLLTHEWYTVIDKDGKSKERYLFLFKARILVCKVRRISEDRSVFVLKDIIRIPEVEVKDHPGEARSFELHQPGASGYPITLVAHKDPVKEYWLKEIRQYTSDVIALAEHAADDLQVTDEPEISSPKAEPINIQPPTTDKPSDSKLTEKRKEESTVKATESKKAKVEEAEDMSRYSSSRYSASSKVVEEYSSVSSSRDGQTTHMESSASLSSGRRESSSLYGNDRVTESSSSYQTVVGGSNVESEMRTARVALSATETGKPCFSQTIEGCEAQSTQSKMALIHVIAGESATFECVLASIFAQTKMQWLKDNRPFNDKLADRVKISRADSSFKLEINNVLESDSGIYTARAVSGDSKASCTAQLIVTDLTPEERKARLDGNKPDFLVRLKDTELLENTYLRFMIKVKGDPNPELKFYKDDVLIDSKNERMKIITEKADKGFYELVIPDVLREDAGKYSCTATNSHGEASCEAVVTVTDDKVIFAGLPEGLLEPGEIPKFKWSRDGVPFDPEERFKVLFKDEEDTLALVFQHVKPEDAGLYTCVAQTSTGNISCSAELTVQGTVRQLLKEPAKPALQSESRHSECSVGGSAMLDLQVKGYPKPDIKWTKNGEEIVAGGRIKYLWEDEESLSLVIKNVTVQDAGTYVIKAKNELGEDSTQIELIVKSAPKITKKMNDLLGQVEETLYMSVQIQASPKPEVKWFKDGQQLEESERISFRKEENDTYTLVIKDARLDDSGSYSVSAKNEVNQTSEFWNVSVRYPPKITKKLLEPQIIDEGDSLTLLIEVEAEPKPTVTWLRDEEVVISDERVKIVQEGKRHMLKITGACHIDAATYRVEVENKDGKSVDSTNIKVRCAPVFRTKLEDTIAKENQVNLELKVKVDSIEEPTVEWFLRNTAITEEKKDYQIIENGDVYRLVINQVKPELAGKYICKIKNQYGENKCEANLTVYTRPKINKKLADQKVNEGETLSLKVEISGTPEPEVKWYKDGKQVDASADARIKISRDTKRKENYDLTLTLIKGSDGGIYEVRAENELGQVSCKSKVIILTKTEEIVEKTKESAQEVKEEDVSAKSQEAEESGPEASPNIISSTLEDKEIFETQNVSFEIKAQALPRPEAKWYKDAEPLKTSDRIKYSNVGEMFQLTIKKAELEDAGCYSCIFTNKLGEKTVDGVLLVLPVEELRKPRFVRPLGDVDVAQHTTGTFKAVATGEPIPVATWYHLGEEIPVDEERYEATVRSEPVEDGLKECTFILKMDNCDLDDVGKYSIKVKNNNGEAESSADLDLLIRPIIEEFKDINPPVGEKGEWEIIIKANPKPDVYWVRNDIDLGEDDRFDFEEDHKKKSYKLIIKQVEMDDAGPYKVVAINEFGEATAVADLTPYTEPPIFTKELKKESVRDQNNYEAEIRVTGYPRPEVQWLKDGVEIENDDRHKIVTSVNGNEVISMYTIDRFSESDAGTITVNATNFVGTSQSVAELALTRFPPKFFATLPKSLNLDEGKPLELSINVDGSPIPVVKWYKDGEEIKPDGHIKLEKLPDGSMKLSIDKVIPTDCGAYKVVSKNSGGEETSLCAVAIKPETRKPSFSKNLEDAKALVGQPLKLEARVDAFPNPQLQWLKDGFPIRPSKEINFVNEPNGLIGLTIDKLRPEDAGVYSLVVSNDLGEITGTANVQVEELEKKPEFMGTIQPLTVVEGFPAKMEVKTIGKPAPTIKWTHNGKQIVPDGQHVKIIDQPDGSQALIIGEVRPQDAGTYEAVASNSQGEISCKGDLEIAKKTDNTTPEEKPTFMSPIRDTTAEEGQEMIFSAPFTGNPIPEVIWTKDGQELKPSEKIMMTCDGKKVGLEINPVEHSDAGVYGCTLRNPLGEDTSKAEANVRKVYQPPTFAQKFTDFQQMPNQDAKFPVRVFGIPQPEISWYFNDTPILRDSNKYKIRRDGDACCLYVKDCQSYDAGKYKCKAVNREGEAECAATFSIVDKIDKKQKVEAPSFLKRLGDCEVYKGMTAKFTACVTGYPEPEFEWFHEGGKLWPTDRILMDQEGSLLRLTLYHIDESDAGKYSLRIFNPHGEDTCHAEMIYESLEPRVKKPLADQYIDYDKRRSGLPLPLSDRPIISRMMDRHLTLSWKPSIPIGPRIPVTYLVEMCELPDGDWFTARSGLRTCVCDIRNLEPFRDYKFRIRVENKYGISDPSPFAQTYRAKLEPEPPKFFPYLPPGIDFRPETSPYFPKDFDIERPPHDGYAQAPRFLRQEHDAQYGVKNHNCNLFWFVYGYPKPKMSYYFNDELIESGGRYDQSYTRNGQATLFINRMLERDVGIYEAVATNEHGQARQRVRLEIAEYPQFIQRPDETVIMLRKHGRIEARVIGVPYPELKWYKDWKPLAPSTRIKIQFVEPDTSILVIDDAIHKDEGLYSLSVRNVAGCISSSAMIHIEENEHEYGYRTYTRKPDIKPRNKPFADYYDIGDELGRGTTGVVYHSVERPTGKSFAAKVMHGGGEYRSFMYNEMDVMNNFSHRKLIRLHDAYETDRTVIIVTELAGGGELVDNLTRQSYYTESDIAGYIRQVLWGLEYMHNNSYAHLGLTLGDLLVSHTGGDDLKIGDFGLSRRIGHQLMNLHYGMPEYVAPEIINGEGVTYRTDMWSVGIITYILLSGISPFRGLNDRETLTRIKEGKWDFDERWNFISDDGKDFIRSLLVYQWERRIDVYTALRHPWLTYADRTFTDPYKIPSENLKNYYKLYKDWYTNASCRTWYRRRKLSSAFEHPSKMVYPPGHRYTPEPSPERTYSPTKRPPPKAWENRIPSREPIDTEIGLIKNESHYQNGPDTYLLQLRDTDFPVRLREYMKVAYNRGSGYPRPVDDPYDWRTPVIRERRRFTDVMDEEIDDERKARINQYGNVDTGTLRRLRHEIGIRLDSYAEAEALMESKKGGHMPFFREKPQNQPIQEDKVAQLGCLAVGNPKPIIQWFKNDMVVQESNRVKITEDNEGRSILSFDPAREYDIGIYKVVARNKVGQTVARTRVLLATVPSAPDSPQESDASDTEILLRWKQPKYDGNSPVLCYNLQYKEGDSTNWIDLGNNIDHEFYLVRDLKPNTSYDFRLAARNRIGWSDRGIPAHVIKTREKGVPKVQVTRAMKHLQQLTESGQEIIEDESKPHFDYSIEDSPINWSTEGQLTSKYSFISELSRGQFSVVVKGVEKSTDKVIVGKILEISSETEEQVNAEYEVLRSLRHEKIALLLSAYRAPESSLAVFILEKLQGADVLTYLSSRHEYTENCVATIISQILDALQYLHWRGYCHMDIQPDNVVMASVRSVQIKLVDMGSAQKVTKMGALVSQVGHPEYRAPEVLNEEAAFPQTDIWMVGVLMYVLLSGVSPFRGEDDNETRQNISFVRFRFEYLFKELSQEATRFLMLIFKRTPSKRPTAEECQEHRWLVPTEFMIRKRERAVFLGNRLKNYSDEYHQEKQKLATHSESLSEVFGSTRQLIRSNSIQDELFTTF